MNRARGWLLLAILVWVVPVAAGAHPLGNFTTNQYVGVYVTPDELAVDYVLDLAEVPASQQRRDIDTDGDGDVSNPEAAHFEGEQCREIARRLRVRLGDDPVDAVVTASHLAFPAGEAGLPTLRLECRMEAEITVGGHTTLGIVNENYPDRLGWREITLSAAGLTTESKLSSTSVTDRLSDYPDERLSSPLDIRSATVRMVPDPDAVSGEPPPPVGAGAPSTATPVDALSSLLDPSSGAPALPIAMVVAVGLGVVHALAPGHGKTVMAAYLVGSNGSLRQALGLGVAVAVSHTVGVLALGVVTLIGTSAFAPESVFPVLSLISALIVTGIGVWLLVRWFRHREPTDERDDSHGGPSHTHALPSGLENGTGWKVLASMGLAGGLVPSASAVVLLLASINLGRVPLGILLIGLFGLGMAATLVGVGFALVAASRFGIRRWGTLAWMDRARRILTPLAALVVIGVGMFLTIQAV